MADRAAYEGIGRAGNFGQKRWEKALLPGNTSAVQK